MPARKKKEVTAAVDDEEQGEATTPSSSRPKRTRKVPTTSVVTLLESDEEQPKTKKKKKKTGKKQKKDDDYVPSDGDASGGEEEIVIDDLSPEEAAAEVEEEPVKKKKKSKTSKTPTKKATTKRSSTPNETEAPSSTPKKETKKKSSSTKKKTRDVRYLTDYLTSELLETVPCPERISTTIVNTRKITTSNFVVNYPQGSSTTISKRILLNTEPQKERKGYTECSTNERGCTAMNLDLHTGNIVNTEKTAALLNIGAPIWAMDWVNRPSDDDDQLVAISPHTLHSSFHKAGKPTRKQDLYSPNNNNVKEPTISDVEHCGKIQIWNLGKLEERKLFDEPYIQFYIEHDHGFVWDLKWMPNSYIRNERLGILACACSDGSVIVFNVPHYSKILTDYNSNMRPAASQVMNSSIIENGKIVLSLKPEVYTQLQHDSDNNTSLKIPYSISWSPNLKYFVSGYHDGTLSLWKVVQNGDHHQGNLLEHIVTIFGHSHPTNDLSIRSISWFDPTMNEYMFATCSNDGFFKIWDVRDIFYPYYSSLSGNRFWITGVAFPEKSNAIIIVSHDGTVRQFDAVENAFQLLSTVDGPIWDVSIASRRSSILITTSTGRVEVLSLEQDSMGKKRRAVDTRVDDLLLQVELVTDRTDFSDNNPTMAYNMSSNANISYSLPYHFKDEKPVDLNFTRLPLRFNDTKITPDVRLSVHRCLYHPSKHDNLKNWCLVGGYDGVVFLLNVPDTYTSSTQ